MKRLLVIAALFLALPAAAAARPPVDASPTGYKGWGSLDRPSADADERAGLASTRLAKAALRKRPTTAAGRTLSSDGCQYLTQTQFVCLTNAFQTFSGGWYWWIEVYDLYQPFYIGFDGRLELMGTLRVAYRWTGSEWYMQFCGRYLVGWSSPFGCTVVP